jgi:pimeloyl-ACP methyl ester carboxylesterase
MLPAQMEQYLDVNGIRTFYLEAGSGHPVLLIHGAAPGACTLVNFGPNIEPLAEAGFRVLAYDQPGFGYSANPEDYSLEYRVTHARAFVDAIGLDRYHVIGNSVGAYIAARFALEDRRVGRLVLVSSSTLAPRGSAEADAMASRHSEELREYAPSLDAMRTMTMKTLFNKDLVTEELVQQRFEMSSGSRYEAQLRRRQAPPPHPILEELPQLKAKTLILWGGNDAGAASERALLLFKTIPEAELHVFDHCGHWVQWDQADRFNRLVADFLMGDEGR